LNGDQPLSQVALHNKIRLAIERIAAHFVIGHDGDEHGHDGRTILGGGYLGPEPFADGLSDGPVPTSAIRLENLHKNPDKKPEPSNRREANRDQVVHFHPGFTPSCHHQLITNDGRDMIFHHRV
jgi:hypothetical protein